MSSYFYLEEVKLYFQILKNIWILEHSLEYLNTLFNTVAGEYYYSDKSCLKTNTSSVKCIQLREKNESVPV